MTIRTLLDLGRVSNLPTVWTNVLAGAVLSGGRLEPWPLALLALAGSLFYVGGMFLNDAFDRDFDARMRSDRPIPSGRATSSQVFTVGILMLGGALALAGLSGWTFAGASSDRAPGKALVAGTVLAGLIVFYDAFHKGNPLSVVVMGLCRAALYGFAAVSLGQLDAAVVAGGCVLLAYVVGLSGVARQETRSTVSSLGPLALLAIPFAYALAAALTAEAPPVGAAGTVTVCVGFVFLAWCLYSLSFLHPMRGPKIPRTVTGLIAGISLLDALLIALHGEPGWALVATLGVPLTVLGQRYVKGT